MIKIGLIGWSYHELIAPNPKSRLTDYAAYLPVVELDTSFYAIPPAKNISKWMDTTPDAFQFLPKAYAPLTGHQTQFEEKRPLKELFETFRLTFKPMEKSGKIGAFLFQFPPTFVCDKEHVRYLRIVRKMMEDLPVAIEFRHPSWFSPEFKEGTLEFLKEMAFIHVVVDQPQTPNNSVPFVSVVTNPDKAFIRLHGRNYEGWLGDESKNWRTFRTLYDYSDRELEEIKQAALKLEKEAKEVFVIFNNNSGGHAAKNALKLQEMLGIDYRGLAPKQLDMF